MPVLAPVITRTGSSAMGEAGYAARAVAPVDPTAARFPAVPAKAGPLRELLPEAVPSRRSRSARGSATRSTSARARRPPARSGSRSSSRAGRRAAKLTVPGPESGGARLAQSGGGADRLGRRDGVDRARGSRRPTPHGSSRSRAPRSRSSTCRASWMYRAPLPRTKLLSPAPAARFSGRLEVDGREIEVDGWRGMAGHNWGAQHAERWIWLHGLTEDGDWLDAAIGRVKVGPLTTPWVANGALSIAGERHVLGAGAPGGRSRRASCTFMLSGRGRARCAARWRRRPSASSAGSTPTRTGPSTTRVNCSIADMRLSVSRGEGAATELVVRGRGRLRAGHARARPRDRDPALSRRMRASAEAEPQTCSTWARTAFAPSSRQRVEPARAVRAIRDETRLLQHAAGDATTAGRLIGSAPVSCSDGALVRAEQGQDGATVGIAEGVEGILPR